MSSEHPEEIVEYERADGADRDGIVEEDNPIPLWFNVTFAATIVFGVIYIPYYVLTDWSSRGQWEAEVAAAQAQIEQVRAELPTTNPFRGDATAIAEGKGLWDTTCAACHKPDGTGLVGPSVVDPYWKYGDDDPALFETVSAGRPLGMPPWGTQLGATKIWKTLAYMETLPKTDEPGIGSPDHQPAAAIP